MTQSLFDCKIKGLPAAQRVDRHQIAQYMTETQGYYQQKPQSSRYAQIDLWIFKLNFIDTSCEKLFFAGVISVAIAFIIYLLLQNLANHSTFLICNAQMNYLEKDGGKCAVVYGSRWKW
ncbi:hypothetical protein FGO68_gene12076 [Halteria grandinella]|uniref:Uncharacterized protein n=1 Tax=Halteria grandinella TaxID=5974 RepID=A0A8J8P198_HALGN|nr:hypothetical protein FGO68_gene12076 [Halteria grandinella]